MAGATLRGMLQASLLAIAIFLGQAPPPLQPPTPPTAPRADTSRPGPWDHDVHVYLVNERGGSTRAATFERAGVPTIARMADGRLIAAHQWFPKDDKDAFDTVAVRFSEEEGRTWSDPRSMVFMGLDEGARYPFDPTLVVLEDGRVRLFFTYMVGSRKFSEATPVIASATSDDGIHFTRDPGIRFAIADTPVIDCSAAKVGDTWHLVCPVMEGGSTRAYHATSSDGLSFTRREDLSGDMRWLGCMVAVQGGAEFYGTRGPKARGVGLPVAQSTNALAWAGATTLRVNGADPGVVYLPDGSRVAVVTGRARTGTASDRREPQRRQHSGPLVTPPR